MRDNANQVAGLASLNPDRIPREIQESRERAFSTALNLLFRIGIP